MYSEGQLPSSATVPVLSLLAIRLSPTPTSTPQDLKKHAKNDTTSYPLTLQEISDVLADGNADLSANGSWLNFVTRLFNLHHIDALFEFFDQLTDLFMPAVTGSLAKSSYPNGFGRSVLLSSSFLGQFVRRAQLEFERIKFEDARALWHSFELYRDTLRGRPELIGHPALTSSSTSASQYFGGEAQAILDCCNARDLPKSDNMSAYDTERLLEFHIDEMQKFGTRISQQLREKSLELIEEAMEKPDLLCYVNFLEAWYKGDYTSSFENLHRYYDLAVHTKNKSMYQYALLNISILQADYGCYNEALAAMDETIAAASDMKDARCLTFCLSWLHHFHIVRQEQETPKSDASYSPPDSSLINLQQIQSQAEDLQMWSVVSTTLLNIAKLSLGEGRPPRFAIEKIYEAAEVNALFNIGSGQAAQLMVQSSTFDRLGLGNLSQAYCNLVVSCYKMVSPAEEVMRAQCRSAYTSLLAGRVDESSKTLEAISPQILRTLKNHQFHAVCVAVINLTKSLHRNNLETSATIVRSLKAVPTSDPELTFQCSMLEIDFLFRRRNLPGALVKIDEMLNRSELSATDLYQRIRLLNAKSLVFIKSGRPQKAFMLTVRACTVAYKAKIMLALWEAVGLLSVVLTSLEEYEQSARLLSAVIYQAMETEDIALIAMLQSARADASMGMAGMLQKTPQEKISELQTAGTWVLAALQSYDKGQDIRGLCEMTAKHAVIERLLGNKSVAEDLLKKHRALIQQDRAARLP